MVIILSFLSCTDVIECSQKDSIVKNSGYPIKADINHDSMIEGKVKLMKRVFLVLFSFAVLTACSAGEVSQSELNNNVPEETASEQEETPAEDTGKYFVVDTEPVSFELEKDAWVQLEDAAYQSASADVYVTVVSVDKKEYFEIYALDLDADGADIKKYTDRLIENELWFAEQPGIGSIEFTNCREAEINGQKGVFYDRKQIKADESAVYSRVFIFFWKDRVIRIHCDAESEDEFVAFEKDFEHVFDTLTIH